MEHVETAVPQPAAPPARLPADGCSVRLSERDAEQVLHDAEHPPAPVAAALEAARRYMKRHEHG